MPVCRMSAEEGNPPLECSTGLSAQIEREAARKDLIRCGGTSCLMRPPTTCYIIIESMGNGCTDAVEAMAAAATLYRAIVEKAGEPARNIVPAELEAPAGAAAVTAEIGPLLEWSRLRCDRSDDQNTVPGGCREPEPEPLPPIIDNWARGMIPLKTLPAPSATPHSKRRQHVPGYPLSLSADSSKSSGENADRTIKSITDDADFEADEGLWGLDDGEGLRFCLTPIPETSNVASTAGFGGISEVIAHGRRREEKSFFEGLQLREQAQEREAAEALERRDRGDHEETRKRNKGVVKGLKRRDWVWDAEGETIPLDIVTSTDKRPLRVIPEVVRVREATTMTTEGEGKAQRSGGITATRTREEAENPAIAPRRRTTTKCDAAFTKPRGEAEAPQEGRFNRSGGGCDKGCGEDDGGGGGGEGRRKRGATKGSRKKGGARRQSSAKEEKRRLSKSFFEIAPTSQPPILDTLDLQAGVCVLEGAEKRLGPRFEEQSKQLVSRGEFFARKSVGGLDVRGAFEDPALLAGDGLSIGARRNNSGPTNASRPPSPPATFPPRQSVPSVAERPEMEDNASLSSGAPMSARGALVDTMRTVDPFLGATRVGKASAREMLPSEAAIELGMFGADHPEGDDPHVRRFVRKGSDPIRAGAGAGCGGARAFKPLPPSPIPRKPGSSHRRGMLLCNKPRMRRPRGHRSRLISPTIARRKKLRLLPFDETLGYYDRMMMPPRERASGGSRCPTNNGCITDTLGDNPPRGSNSDYLRPHPPAIHQQGASICTTVPRRQNEGDGKMFPPISVQVPSTVEGVMVRGGVKSRRGRFVAARAGWIKSYRPIGTLKQILLPTM